MDGKTSAKAEQRRLMRKTLSQMDAREISRRSAQIRDQLNFPNGATVALFAGTSREPQLLELMENNPEVNWFFPRVTGETEMEFLPVSNRQNLRKGYLGILEPFEGHPPADLDCIVCPGLAFTPSGLRLGQGGGFYDRILEHYPSSERIGTCFSCQLVEQLQVASHDVKMHRIVTDLREQPN